MEMLNAFDLIVAEQKPKTEMANHVYRMILKAEREKTYQSIQNISSEIFSLKSILH